MAAPCGQDVMCFDFIVDYGKRSGKRVGLKLSAKERFTNAIEEGE